MNPAERCIAIGDQFDTMQDLRRAYKAYTVNRISNLKQAIQSKSGTESTVSAPSNAPGISTQL